MDGVVDSVVDEILVEVVPTRPADTARRGPFFMEGSVESCGIERPLLVERSTERGLMGGGLLAVWPTRDDRDETPLFGRFDATIVPVDAVDIVVAALCCRNGGALY